MTLIEKLRALTSKRWLALVGDGLLLLVVVLAAIRFVLPSFNGWYSGDDDRNVRWVLEYHAEPWRALTERHALHDHIRPLTLMALWAGSMLSNGAFWGPHLVEALLHVGGLLGLVVLARDLGGSWRAGLLTALFATGIWGFEKMMEWTAWIGSAGEVCFGLWGLVVARRALARPGLLPLAMLLVVAAGLCKEPGSVVYPLVVAAMAIGAWQDGVPPRRAGRLFALLPVGALTFAFTWHAANLNRMDRVGLPLMTRLHAFFTTQTDLLINGWPGWGIVPARFGAGIPLLAFVAVVVDALVGRAGVRSPKVRLLWLFSTLGIAEAGYLWSSFGHLIVLPAALLLLLRDRRRPSAGLVLYAAMLAVMMPFWLLSEVQLLAAGYGLALFVGIATNRMLNRRATGELAAPAVAALVIVAQIAMLGSRTLIGINPETYQRQQKEMREVLGVGALARTLGVSQAENGGSRSLNREILPLVGVFDDDAASEASAATDLNSVPLVGVLSDPPGGGEPGAELQAELLFTPRRADVERALLTPDRLRGQYVPALGTQGGGGDRSGAAVLELDPGYYALGIRANTAAQTGLTLNAMDSCDHSWSVTPDRLWMVGYTVRPIYLARGCRSLRLWWSGSPNTPAGIAFVAPLQEPIQSLSFPTKIQRVLRVRPDADLYSVPVLGGQAEQGGAR